MRLRFNGPTREASGAPSEPAHTLNHLRQEGVILKDYMEHKGYIGSVRFSAEDDVFHGKLQKFGTW
jgi:hypothetical protein